MSKKKKLVLILCFTLLCFFIVIAYLSFYSLREEAKLKVEVKALTKLDITKDRYNTSIKTKGNYAVVEKAIKSYLDSYAVNMQEVLKLSNDSKLTKILTIDNYSSDGKEFTTSLSYLSTSKTSFDKAIDKLIVMCDQDSIMNNIKTKHLSSYYVNLYNKLMLEGNMSTEFNSFKKTLKTTKTSMDNLYDNTTIVINFLVTNKDNYEIKDGKILFKTSDELTTYNSLVSKVTNK
jgi:hypothetical protein